MKKMLRQKIKIKTKMNKRQIVEKAFKIYLIIRKKRKNSKTK